MLFYQALFDVLVILVMLTVATQIVIPLANRDVTFPLFRRFAQKISQPKQKKENTENEQ